MHRLMCGKRCFFSFVIGIVLILTFSVLRKSFKSFYLPKRIRSFSNENGQSTELHTIPRWSEPEVLAEHSGTGLFNRFFAWISYTFLFSENQLLEQYGGYDMVVYLRFLKLSMILFAILSLFGLIILLPINATSTNQYLDPNNDQYIQGMRIYTIANIPQGSSTNWAPLISVVIFSGFAYLYIYYYHLSLNQLRKIQIEKNRDVISRSIMVHDIPKRLRTEEAFRNYFLSIYGEDRVLHTVIVPKAKRLRSMKEKRDNLLKKWARANDILKETGKRIRHQRKSKFLTSPLEANVDSIDYYEKKLQALDEKIIEEQSFDMELGSTGFVTFSSVTVAMLAAQALHESNPFKMKIKLAPEMQDINWGNLTLKRYHRWTRFVIIVAILVVLFLFWTIPVAFIQAFSNLDALSQISGLSFLVNVIEWSSFVSGLVEGFLPTLALVVFMSLLPWLLRTILSERRYFLKSQLERAIFHTYWQFLLLNVFLITTLSGSIFGVLHQIIESPSSIVSLLATNLPAQSFFFITYITLQAFISYPLQLSRLPDFIVCKLKQKLFCKTLIEKQEAENPQSFNYARFYSQDQLIFCISLTYSSMCPLLLPFTFAYFVMAYIVAKYNFIFVFTPPIEGYNMSPIVGDRLFVSVLIYQVTMFGVLTLKLFPPGIIVLLLILCSALYWHYAYSRFHRPNHFISLTECITIGESDSSEAAKQLAKEAFMDPCLLPPESIHNYRQQKSQLQQSPPLLRSHKNADDLKDSDSSTSSLVESSGVARIQQILQV